MNSSMSNAQPGGSVESAITPRVNITNISDNTEPFKIHSNNNHHEVAAATETKYLIPPPTNVSNKRVIRKITPIDLKKLQQSGLDRKIAEAISKHKSQLALSSKPLQRDSNIKQHIPPSHPTTSLGITNVTTVNTTTSSKLEPVAQQQYMAKCPVMSKTIIPPKITITEPETPTEVEVQDLDGLNSQQRLIHVKNLLNKKLLQKQSSTNDGSVKLYKHLKSASDTSACLQNKNQNNLQVHHKELLTIADKIEVKNSKSFIKLKDTEAATRTKDSSKLAESKTPQKSPKDIARKLDFESEINTNSVQQPKRIYKKSLNSDISIIPKASLKTSCNQEEYSQSNFSYGNKDLKHHGRQKIDFPEVSPLKINFPTANVPQEAPLPNIDSFKKPYSLSSAEFHDPHASIKVCAQTNFIPTHYGTSSVLQQSNSLGNDLNTQFSGTSETGFENDPTSAPTNCLIVLENKILSQDEMIDLTELRLSTSKIDTPRFATPHKPIQEVVIKQEKIDDYSTISPPLLIEEVKQNNISAEIKPTNKNAPIERVVLSTKQNKKIIINAQKLKLPPDQLANLAKQIAQRSSVSSVPLGKYTNISNSIITSPIQQSKNQSITTVDSNVDNKSSIIKVNNNQHCESVSTHCTNNIKKDLNNSYPANNTITQTYSDSSKQCHKPYYLPESQQNFVPNVTSERFVVKKAPFVNKQNIKTIQNVKLITNKQREDEFECTEKHSNRLMVIVKEEPKINYGISTTIKDVDQNSSFNSTNKNSDNNSDKQLNRSIICYRKPAVEIVDEPTDTEDCFSAVDFIAALNETHPITEETSLELSPEELNLNASCAMNLSPLRIDSYMYSKTQQHSQGGSTFNEYSSLPPKIGNIINVSENTLTMLNPQEMSTIVIESLNGPETIVTKDSGDIRVGNTLQHIQVGSDMGEIDIENPQNSVENVYTSCREENVSVIECIKKPEHSEVSHKSMKGVCSEMTDISQIFLDFSPSKNSTPCIPNKLIRQNNNVCESNTGSKSIESPITNELKTINKEHESHEKLENNVAAVMVQSNSLVQNPEQFEETVTTISNKICKPVTKIKNETFNNSISETEQQQPLQQSAETVTDTKSMLKSSPLVKEKVVECDETIPQLSILTPPVEQSKSTEDENSAKPNVDKISQKSENSKSNEKNSAGTVISKRISRFKKGKINLVQRNKQIAAKEQDQNSNRGNKLSPTNENNADISTTNEPFMKEHSLNIETSDKENKDIIIKSNKQYIETSGSTLNTEYTVKSLDHQVDNKCNDKSFDRENQKEVNEKNCITTIGTERLNNSIPEQSLIPEAIEKDSIEETMDKEALVEVSPEFQIKENKEEKKPLKSNESNENTSQLREPNIVLPTKEDNAVLKIISEDGKEAKELFMDVEKHSPLKSSEDISPIIPLEMNSAEISQKSPNHEGSNNLKQLKASKKDVNKIEKSKQEEDNEQTEESTSEINKINNISCISDLENPCSSSSEKTNRILSIANDKNETATSTRTSSRSPSESGRNTQAESTAYVVSVNSRSKQSTKQLISDDDLEFKSVSAGIKQLELSKYSTNVNIKSNGETEKKQDCISDTAVITTPITSNIFTRRTRLYSKPTETKLSGLSPSITKRTRFYSQTLETNDTIQFDSLKLSLGARKKSSVPLTTEDSYQDSVADKNDKTILFKQYSKLRKTLEDKNKSENSRCDTDSEDDNRDLGCTNDCEESNEFLGFEEENSNLYKNLKNLNKQNIENVATTKTKGGTLKNWLTTGKAVSPTLTEKDHTKYVRHDESTSSSSVARGSIPLKKRWDLSANLHKETDITDDTSPADDKEECENMSTGKSAKRGIHNVIDSKKNVLVSKKKKFDETNDKTVKHRFIKPRQLRIKSKKSRIDSESHDELKLPISSNSNKIKEEQYLNTNTKSNNSETDFNCHEGKSRKRVQSNINKINSDNDIESLSGIDSDYKDKKKGSRSRNSKINKVNITDSGDCQQEKRLDHLKYETENANKNSANTRVHSYANVDTNSESESKRCVTSKQNVDDSNIVNKINKVMKSSNSDNKSNCHKEKRSKKRMSKHAIKKINKNCEHLNASHKNENKMQTSNDKNLIELNTSLQSTWKVKIEKINIKKVKNSNSDKKLKENSKESIVITHVDNYDNDTEKTLPYLDKKLKTKKKRHVETQISPASKKPKLKKEQSGPTEQDIACTSLEEDANDPVASSQLIPFNSQQDLNLKKPRAKPSVKVPLKKSFEMENSDIDLLPEKPNLMPTIEIIKNDTPVPPARGRKRKSNIGTVCNFNPRLLLITKREQLDTDEILTETNPGDGSVQCGLCLDRTYPVKWPLHLAEHYGIGWKVGEEKLNIESRSVVLKHIILYMKETASKGLNCRMCKKTYRSGAGLLMHIEACGAEVIRITCEFCKKEYAKSTFQNHLRSCHVKFALEDEVYQTKKDKNETKEEVFSNTGRVKRNSTIKAENKLKVIGQQLDEVLDNKEEREFDPKERIKYIPPIAENFNEKWSEEIKSSGKGSCPKKVCKFTSDDLKALSEHITLCKYIKTGYFCKSCRHRAFNTEKEAIDHVIKSHQNSNDSDCDLKTDCESSSDDYDLSEDDIGISADEVILEEEDEEKTKKNRKNKKPYNRVVNQSASAVQRKRVFDGRYTDLNSEVLKKWKSFLKQNYSIEPLFTKFYTEFSVKSNQNFSKYLPSNIKSMKFNISSKATLTPSLGEPESNIEWSQLNQFESLNNKMDTFFYLGAPVKFCTWIPLPIDVDEQYLMVSYRKDANKFTKFLNPKQHCTIILIFKVTQNKGIPKLKIHYGLIVNDGPVHHVAFLPSGGYDAASNRLGLVAVATVNSSIKIYALPISVENTSISTKESDNNEKIIFIDVKPSFLLNIDVLKQEETDHVLLKTQCLQICWSEFFGHQHIFASFSNGFIGIWDILNDSQENLNRFVVENVVNFVPLNYFYLGEKCVKYFAIHYDTYGPRWLAASGLSRKFVIYDIKCLTQPIIMKEDCHKSIILSMDWCPLWETILYSYCDSFPNNGKCVVVVNPTNVMFPQNKLDLMVGGVTQVHYSPVTNMCVATVENGDLLFLNTKELHYEYPLGKQFGDRRILSAMDIKQLNGEGLFRLPKGSTKNLDDKITCNWTLFEENYRDKYGLIFKPFIKLKENMKGNYFNEKRNAPLNVIPLLRINALRCNLNLNAKHLVAVGYENGFLRIVYFNKDTQMYN